MEYLVCFNTLQQALEKTILKLQTVVDWGNVHMDITTRIRVIESQVGKDKFLSK